jgi:hypothetical protein
MLPQIGPRQYALNASGKEAIKLGSMSALGQILLQKSVEGCVEQ